MGERLDIYYRKKNLVSSFLLYLLSLIFWLFVYFRFLFPLLINPHPNVNAIMALILGIVLTAVFAAYAIKFIRVLCCCIGFYRNAPSIAYSLDSEGVKAAKCDWQLSWSEIQETATMVKNEGIFLRYSKGRGYSIYSWGVDKTEIELAKKFIKGRLEPEKTKRLK